MPKVLAGDKFIALAISEAFAGSDVQGLQTTARKTPDGKHFIVNGTKKWITNGTFADYFSVAVKDPDSGKMSMLFIPRQDGLETKPIKTSYSPAAGTAYVTFDDVKVPAENLLGVEGKGLHVVLSNFNHERWVMTVITIRWSRAVTEEAFKWAHQRVVFGKPLIQQPVIRQKFAECFALIEANAAWNDFITGQMCAMSYAEMADNLAVRAIRLILADARRDPSLSPSTTQRGWPTASRTTLFRSSAVAASPQAAWALSSRSTSDRTSSMRSSGAWAAVRRR